jgi:hypothetical protein
MPLPSQTSASLFAAVALFTAATPNGFGKETTVSVPASPTEAVTLTYPERFVFVEFVGPDDGGRPSLQFRMFPNPGECALYFRILVEPDGEMFLRESQDLETFVKAMTGPYLSSSLENNVEVRSLGGTAGNGFYCVLTVADPKGVQKNAPNQYFRYVLFAGVKVESYVFTVIGYANAKDDANFESVLNVLRSINVTNNAVTSVTTEDLLR